MNSTLSFRKESIQRSSNASEALRQLPEAMGSRQAHDYRRPAITTILTTIPAP